MTDHWLTHPQARPRYRSQCPLLWRSDGLAQIGEGRRHIVTPLDQPLAAWLLSLSGLSTMAQLQEQVSALGLTPSRAQALLRMAAHAGAIDDASQLPTSWRYMDPIARAACEPDHGAALLTFGNPGLAHALIDQRHRTHVHLTTPANQRPPSHLRDCVEQAICAAGLSFTADPFTADLTVILGSHPVIGSEVASVEVALPSSAHLFVASYGDRAVAGPLVMPGQTSCLRCAYLHTRDADPQWPHVSLQLTHAITKVNNAPIDRLLTSLIATYVGKLARAWTDRNLTHTQWKNLSYELRLPECEVRIEPRLPHPLCQCQWTLEGGLIE
ncbi:MAG: hypothetical protein PHN51_04840 [Candidatus Nanopelagicales bacterium]|nr:hypothetical protein [Candidatus Nanopelagicales bacterium]